MRIPLSEIWNFTDILEKAEERSISFTLHAGDANIGPIDKATLEELRSNKDYDTELLPFIFTFREILWQPDVYTEASMCLPSLRVLSAYCSEEANKYELAGTKLDLIYNQLLLQMAASCDHAHAQLELKNLLASQVLGQFRRDTFPIIKFFIGHPQNRKDYYQDAINRLNYAVKIMITQLHGKYTDLQDPFWEISLVERINSAHSVSKSVPKKELPIEKE
jgi:hypothetical protein